MVNSRESEAARHRVRPIFIADWVDVLFMHFEVDPTALSRQVPVELDLHEGNAYVSLVAFTQKRLRPQWGGRFSEWLSAPLGEHEFLNVRTYVRVAGERGIYFLVEWIPNRLARALGPCLYGLPYRLGRFCYDVDEQAGCIRGDVQADGRLQFEAVPAEPDAVPEPHETALDDFLLERYTAFTFRNDALRRFRIWHEPWPQVTARCRIHEQSLLTGSKWIAHAQLVRANYSPGVRDVLIGQPQTLSS
jgi:uncharacterized protein YqjF (DUF2071 family)